MASFLVRIISLQRLSSRIVPGSRFPKRRFLRARDEAPAFMENIDFTPDIYFFDAAEAGLRYLAAELRKRGVLIYFEPESDADKNKFQKAVEVSDIVKFSHEKVSDLSFVDQYADKLFIRTMGADGLEFKLCGQEWMKVASVPNDNVVDWEGAGDWTTSQFIACLCERDLVGLANDSRCRPRMFRDGQRNGITLGVVYRQ